MLRGKNHWTLNLGLYNWTGKRTESGIDLTSLVLNRRAAVQRAAGQS